MVTVAKVVKRSFVDPFNVIVFKTTNVQTMVCHLLPITLEFNDLLSPNTFTLKILLMIVTQKKMIFYTKFITGEQDYPIRR